MMIVTGYVLFWGALVLSAYIYAGFPLLLHVAARCFGRRPCPDDTYTPAVSLLISAYNEEKVIAERVENAQATDYPEGRLQICLVSDGSCDDTVAIAKRYAALNLLVLDLPERRGKQGAINAAASTLTGEIVVFTDANSYYRPDAIRKLVRHFSDPRVGLVVGRLSFVSEGGEPVDGGMYWRMENRMKELQSALGAVLVANGSIFAVRRSLLSTMLDDVANDFQIPMEVGGQGYAILYEPEAVALEKSVSNQREEFRRKVRIVLRGMTGTRRLHRHVRGRRLFFFLSHKLLRWLGGYTQMAMLVGNILLVREHAFYATALALQAVFYACAAAGWLLQDWQHAPRLIRVPFYFCMVNWAAVVASVQFLCGKRARMWETARTAR